VTDDMFPVYCRFCRSQIPADVSNCPRCGKPQSLSPRAPSPPPAEPAKPAAASAAPAGMAAAATAAVCPHCGVSITPGDYFCRACGRALAAGVPDPSKAAAGAAYGIAGLVSVLMCFPLGGIVFGIVALAKGERALGISSILAGIAVMTAAGLLYAAALARILSALPALAPLRDLAP